MLDRYCSPRRRARETLELLRLRIGDGVRVEMTEDLREWDYGDYEGLTAVEINEKRVANGSDGEGGKWNIWRHGCEGGE